MAERSEHHPKNPTWSVDNLEGRLDDLSGIAANSEAEAEVTGSVHLDFLINWQYPRYVGLLEDVRCAVAAAEADARKQGTLATEFRDEDDDGRELLPALRDLEAEILHDLNDKLAAPFAQAAAEGQGQPFYPSHPEDQDRVAWLRTLMRDFRWLQNAAGLQRGYGERLGLHFEWMQRLINACLPEKDTLWVGGDLIGNEDFEELWAEFQGLVVASSGDGTTAKKTDAENRRLVENSQNIVQDAFDALLLDPANIEVDWSEMQYPPDVPAYLVHPPSAEQFWEGEGVLRGQRDGAQQLMENLGYTEGARS
ncbi:hypothetical protein PG994_003049 [Apiospora phragmitis]|uniref:Uncharacterized protein n=1 Tax=Apiospora phragmitis TaxID=2905665 RepID=A0ABR1W764_9PEZI